MVVTLSLPQSFIDEMVAHAQEDAPNECCGMIAGDKGRAVKVFRAKNAEASPYRYSVEPKDLFRIYRECEENGWSFLAIYHSHTASEAYPSATDVRLALWPRPITCLYRYRTPQSPWCARFASLRE